MEGLTHQEQMRKKLRYRAQYRGTKEADRLVGGFVESCIESLSALQLKELEQLLSCSDVQLMAWGFSHEAPPPAFRHELMEALKHYFEAQ